MRLNKILKNTLLVISAGIILTACATKKEVAVEAPKKEETKKAEQPCSFIIKHSTKRLARERTQQP